MARQLESSIKEVAERRARGAKNLAGPLQSGREARHPCFNRRKGAETWQVKRPTAMGPGCRRRRLGGRAHSGQMQLLNLLLVPGVAFVVLYTLNSSLWQVASSECYKYR